MYIKGVTPCVNMSQLAVTGYEIGLDSLSQTRHTSRVQSQLSLTTLEVVGFGD